MKLLTHDGLIYFWSKIKNYVDTKYNTLNTSYNTLNTSVTSMSSQISTLNTSVTSINSQISTINTNVAAKVSKSTTTNVTLAVASWSGTAAPYSYTISNSNITASNVVEFVFPSGTAQSVIDAWNNASIGRYTQAAGSIVLYANGVKPTVAMTLTMIIRRDI